MSSKVDRNPRASSSTAVEEPQVFGSIARNTAKAQRDHSMSDPGQQNFDLVNMNPNSSVPPPTDHGVVEPVWYSFDLTHRRVQEGGWTHQVTERELRSSKEHAGVDMRITKGGFREMHWHLADEWAIMLKGDARVTVLSPDGSMFIDDVKENDLWLFPAGYPHSIQGTGEDGCEFLLVFNQGDFSEESTFLLSDWLMHTPPEILQKNFGLGGESIAKLPKDEPLYIFPSNPPTQTLEQDRTETEKRTPKPKQAFTFKTDAMPPSRSNQNGSAKIIDVRNFPASKRICAALVNIKPGGMRELHWHPNASEWQFWVKGKGRMTVFNAQETSRTMDFNANDVGYVPKMAGHYVENTGDEDLMFLEIFATGEYQDISLNQWLRAMPAQVATAHTNLSAEELEKIPSEAKVIIG
jgi:oxalate decarboxylase